MSFQVLLYTITITAKPSLNSPRWLLSIFFTSITINISEDRINRMLSIVINYQCQSTAVSDWYWLILIESTDFQYQFLLIDYTWPAFSEGWVNSENKITGNPIYHLCIINCSEWNCFLPMKFGFEPYEKAPYPLNSGCEKIFFLVSVYFNQFGICPRLWTVSLFS